MKHNPSNPLCDLVMYAGSAEVRCTCDVDDPDDAPRPSTVVAPSAVGRTPAGQSGSEAAAYAELKAAAIELKAAQQLVKPAEERWRKALDALHAEMLR